MIWKFGKVHMLPYAGLWVILGVVLITILKAQKIICELKGDGEGRQNPWACDFAVTQISETVAVTVFGVASFLSIFGGLFTVIAFSRVLRHTHHTLTHIADPTGPLMQSLVWEAATAAPSLVASRTTSNDVAGAVGAATRRVKSLDKAAVAARLMDAGLRDPPSSLPNGKPMRVAQAPPGSEAVFVKRPVLVGSGFPWCGVMMQLCVEFIIMSPVVTLIYGTLPAVMSMLQLIRGGHRMEYVVAAKPGSSSGPTGSPRIVEEE